MFDGSRQDLKLRLTGLASIIIETAAEDMDRAEQLLSSAEFTKEVKRVNDQLSLIVVDDFKNIDEVKRRKEYIIKNLTIPNYDISGLLDKLFEINNSSINLNIESDKAKGYIIDSIGAFDTYFKKNGGGWDKLYEDNPRALGIVSISVPAYDKGNEIILVYRGTQRHGLAGAGWINAYRLRDGKVKRITGVILWKS